MILECIGWHLNLKFKIFYQHGLVWHIFVALLIKSVCVLVRKGTVCFWRQLIFFRPFGKKCLTKMYSWMIPGKTDIRNLKFGVWIQKSSSTEWSSHSQVKTTLYILLYITTFHYSNFIILNYYYYYLLMRFYAI